MPHAFDATLKDLVRRFPADYLRLFRIENAPQPRVLNVDLATVSAATDVVLGLGEPLERAIDVNFQSSRDAELAPRLLFYNAALHLHLRVPVHSIVVLLRPAADGPALDGKVRYEGLPQRSETLFTYEVVRLWRRPVEELLSAGPGALPLAVLAEMPGGASVRSVKQVLPRVLQELDARLTQAPTSVPVGDLWTAAFVLTGLRLPREEAVGLFKGVLTMKESTTYQYIVEQGLKEGRKEGRKEGALHEARRLLLLVGEDRFGKPSAAVKKALNAIDDLERLHRMSKRLLKVESWKELLETP